MATKIVTKNSSTAGAAPTATDLVQGELAVNVADGRLYTEDNAAAIVELGVNPATEITANAGIALPDSQKATFGDAGDLEIFHNGSHSYIRDTGTGNLRVTAQNFNIRNAADNASIFTGVDGGAVISFYNGDQKLATTSTGIDVTGDVALGDNDKATFGASDDLQIYHDGTDSFISDQGTGNLKLLANDFRLANAANNELMLKADQSSAVTAYYAGAAKLATTSTGIDVTGTASATSVTSARHLTAGSAYSLLFGDGGERISGNNSSSLLNFFTGATERMRIDSSGNVGIGTSDLPSSEAKLTLSGTGASTAMYFGAYTDYNYIRSIRAANNVHHMTFGYKYSGGSDVERMRIDSSGNLLLNTANSPTTTKAIISSDYSATGTTNTGLTITGRQGGNWWNNGIHALGASGLVFSTATSGTNGADATNERMRIDGSGNLLLGTTSARTGTHSLTLESGNSFIQMRAGGTTALSQISFMRDTTGTPVQVGVISTTGTSTSYNTSSDQRLKENIADADEAGSKIDAIQVRQYDWKADGSHQDYGMIAQELQAVAPEAVSGDADSEEMMGVDYSKLVPMLIKEIQSLRNRVAQLEE